MLARAEAGDLTARLAPSSQDDAIDQLIRQINQILDALSREQQAKRDLEQRSDELLDYMTSLATRNYSRRASVNDVDSVFDALAAGLNMLADELVAGQEAQIHLQAEIIQAQEAAIQELSTPLIPITDELLVMPLIGTLDTKRMQQVLNRLLNGIAESRAATVILDITGIAVVDSQVANGLIRAAQAAQLLGARIILTGIRPEVAQALVGLAIDLRHIVTWSTLQAGIAYATSASGE